MSNIRVIKKIGKKTGKTIVILAGIHGNEKCGINAFDELIPTIEIEKGTVIFIYSNLQAIQENKRFIDVNLNRCFFQQLPKELENTLEGKTSREIIPYLNQADAMLDIHSSNTPDSIPFIISEPSNNKISNILPIDTLSYNWDAFEPGATDYFMNLQKKPGLAVECGYLKDVKSTEIAKNCILNFLIYFEAIPGKLKKSTPKKRYKITSIYINKEHFIPSRFFSDFEQINEKTLIGIDGEEKIVAPKGSCLLFVRERKEPGQECFLTAEKD